MKRTDRYTKAIHAIDDAMMALGSDDLDVGRMHRLADVRQELIDLCFLIEAKERANEEARAKALAKAAKAFGRFAERKTGVSR